MDPQRCLYDALLALYNNDRHKAILHLESLLAWLDRGGFMPQVRAGISPTGKPTDDLDSESLIVNPRRRADESTPVPVSVSRDLIANQIEFGDVRH